MKAMVRRQTLLVVLAVFCQGIMAVHDGQHIDAQPSTCSVCQAHLPLITGEPPDIISALSTAQIVASAPRCIETVETDRPYATFQSRAPPGSLT